MTIQEAMQNVSDLMLELERLLYALEINADSLLIAQGELSRAGEVRPCST